MHEACTTEPEEWRPVVGFEGLYEVSDLGRVRSVDRIDRTGHRRRGRVLRPSLVSGYPIVSLANGPVLQRLVHHLVLEAFAGPCPEGQEACHENDDRVDARLSNLRWDTHQSNIDDRTVNGGTARGERSGTAKLTEERVREIRRARASGESQRSVAARFGVSQGTVSFVTLRQTWKHVA